jgi:hypothetical protein
LFPLASLSPEPNILRSFRAPIEVLAVLWKEKLFRGSIAGNQTYIVILRNHHRIGVAVFSLVLDRQVLYCIDPGLDLKVFNDVRVVPPTSRC